MNATKDITVISFNIAGARDLEILARKLITVENKKVSETAKTILKKSSETVPVNVYKTLSEEYFLRLIDTVDPDIFCLQELFKNRIIDETEHGVIKQVLKKKKYNLCFVEGTGIAFKKSRFSTDKKGYIDGAYYADLKMDDLEIRVISDHAEFGLTGKDALENHLKIFEDTIEKKKDDLYPNLVIFGMDANGTRRIPGEDGKDKNVSLQWQPERTELFDNRGYQTIKEDDQPTYKYQNVKQKIDHIYWKAHNCAVEKATSLVIKGINDSSILDAPEKFPASDHLPVIYKLSIKKLEQAQMQPKVVDKVVVEHREMTIFEKVLNFFMGIY